MSTRNRVVRWLSGALLMVLVGGGLASCGGDQDADRASSTPAGEQAATVEVEAPPTGNAGNGETLFASRGCDACHAVDAETVMIGPALGGVAVRAAEAVDGMDAAAYLRQSVIEPDAYIVEGFQKGVMPAYATLSEQEITDLVAYLLTLDE